MLTVAVPLLVLAPLIAASKAVLSTAGTFVPGFLAALNVVVAAARSLAAWSTSVWVATGLSNTAWAAAIASVYAVISAVVTHFADGSISEPSVLTVAVPLLVLAAPIAASKAVLSTVGTLVPAFLAVLNVEVAASRSVTA